MRIENLGAVAALAGCLACARRPAADVLREGDTLPDIEGLSVKSGSPTPFELRFELGDERGRVVMLAFGYTSCVSVCPLTLSTMGSIYRHLGSEADSLDALFVSIDPRRDTPDRMRAFLGDYNSRIRGVLLPEPSVPPLLRRFGISAARLPPEIRRYVGRTVDPERDYALDHSPTIWVVDGSGRLRGRYDAGAPAEDIAAGILRLIHSQAVPARAASAEPSGA